MTRRMTNAEATAARERQQKQGEPDRFDEAVQKLKAFAAKKRAERVQKLTKAHEQGMPVNYTIVDMATGEICGTYTGAKRDVQRQKAAKKPNHVVMEGHYPDGKFVFDLEAGEFAEKPVTIGPDRVNSECSARIRRKYSEHDQINAALEGGKAAKDVFEAVTAHRNAAKALKGLDPIPLDFKDDKYWP